MLKKFLITSVVVATVFLAVTAFSKKSENTDKN